MKKPFGNCAKWLFKKKMIAIVDVGRARQALRNTENSRNAANFASTQLFYSASVSAK